MEDPAVGGDGVNGEGEQGDVQPQLQITPRAYQLEMVEESLRRNIIVAMDTGSGKTLIATMRIQAELERCPPDKMVWFCVPGVALAYQQHKVVEAQLPMHQSLVLTGKDNCEYWRETTWSEVLWGTRIVISTHKILLDALVHAFVTMSSLALLVFDEAHRATKEHPANEVMQRFYHQLDPTDRPHILGLTASPLINDKVEKLKDLEANLNALSRTPKATRSELLRFSNRPRLVALQYSSAISVEARSIAFKSLCILHSSYDIERDPWVIKMRSDERTKYSSSLHKALMKGKTWCSEQIRTFYNRAETVYNELGPAAADMYICKCIDKACSREYQCCSSEMSLEESEKSHLMKLLLQLDRPTGYDDEIPVNDSTISLKLRTLVDFLEEMESPSFAGLVFVRTRVEVATLLEILSRHPRTKRFEISTFVGESESSNRKALIGEFADIRKQKTTLDDLRHGRKNLVITTNALEEGIDVSACNVVVCFEAPPNLKSFIQRRGRARQIVSTYAIMLDICTGKGALLTFEKLEEDMRKMYEDDMRKLEELKCRENREVPENRTFLVEKTGAKLGLSDAVSHLYHFCSTLSTDPYADSKPIFHFKEETDKQGSTLLRAKVTLPCSVDISVREATATELWDTEKGAKRDAAFTAYVALYEAGLVDDHLLPIGRILKDVEEAFADVEKRPNVVSTLERVDIWSMVARLWLETSHTHETLITVIHEGKPISRIRMVLPLPYSEVAQLTIQWDLNTAYSVEIGPQTSTSAPLKEESKCFTRQILQSVLKGRVDAREDFTALFLPHAEPNRGGDWLSQTAGSTKFAIEQLPDDIYETGLVRDLQNNSVPSIFQEAKIMNRQEMLDRYLVEDGDGHDNPQIVIKAKRFPKNFDFLHTKNSSSHEAHTEWLLAEHCEIDRLPLRYSLTASFIPTILHVVEKGLIVDLLCQTLLGPLGMKSKNLVATAISAPSAREGDNYQRLEFLGDSILKYLTSLNFAAANLTYHEGILARMKDHTVSNGNLSRMAIELKLSQFVLTKAFTGKKWRPTYNSDFTGEPPERTRELSTKILADVIESLIGAAFLEGGLSKAVKCLQILIPHTVWSTPEGALAILQESYPKDTPPHARNELLVALLGHTFTVPSILQEALTHPSYRIPSWSMMTAVTSSYQRLEFLGDSILDTIVTMDAFNHSPDIPVPRLHLIRTALVNGTYLGYLCLSHSTPTYSTEVNFIDKDNINTVGTSRPFYLWQAMRFTAPAVAEAQKLCVSRFEELQHTLSAHFHPMSPQGQSSAASSTTSNDFKYPWALLILLAPPKFFSDLIESLLGALFIDSNGSLDVCRRFLDQLGWTAYLHRVLECQGEGLMHPKEEVGVLAGVQKVRYEVQSVVIRDTAGQEMDEPENDTVPSSARNSEESGGRKELVCKVFVGEEMIVEIGGGRDRVEVETRAAEKACEILREWVMDTEPTAATLDDDHKNGDEDIDEGVDNDDDDRESKDPSNIVEEPEGGVKIPLTPSSNVRAQQQVQEAGDAEMSGASPLKRKFEAQQRDRVDEDDDDDDDGSEVSYMTCD